MINQQVLAGHWNEVRGKLKEKWAELTDDDLLNFSGDVDQLIGRIQQKTGETREAIEAYLDTLAEQGASLAAAARDKMAGVADDMRSAMKCCKKGSARAMPKPSGPCRIVPARRWRSPLGRA